MSMKNKLKNFFSMEDEEYEYEYIETERESHEEHEQKEKPAYNGNKPAGKQNVVSLQSVQKSSKVVLSEPRLCGGAGNSRPFEEPAGSCRQSSADTA